MLTFVSFLDSFSLVWLCPGRGDIVVCVWLGVTLTLLGWLGAKFERDAFEGDEVIYISKVSTSLGTGNYLQRLWDPHPMILILRPSKDASEREPCWTNRIHIRYFIGVFQLFWICFLSFFFSSTIGGTLFRTLLLVVAFIGIVGISRGLSILACWLAQKYLDLRVIEYDNLEEKKMMQRLLGGLTGVRVDIRWMSNKKSHWKESVKMYRWGQQLSRGNMMEVPDDTERSTLHTQTQRIVAFMGHFTRMVVVTSTVSATIVLPNWLIRGDSSLEVNQRVQMGAGIVIIVATAFSCLYLGRTRRLLICRD